MFHWCGGGQEKDVLIGGVTSSCVAVRSSVGSFGHDIKDVSEAEGEVLLLLNVPSNKLMLTSDSHHSYLAGLRCCCLHKYLPLMASQWRTDFLSLHLQRFHTCLTVKQTFIKCSLCLFCLFDFTDIMTLECWCFKNDLRHPDCHKAQCLKRIPTADSGQPTRRKPKAKSSTLKQWW